MRARGAAAAGPVCGFVLTYVFFALTPWGRAIDVLTLHGSTGTGYHVRRADTVLMETISTGSVLLALATLVVVGGLRGRWRLALRSTVAVLGAVESAELLKHLLPSLNFWNQQWRWLHGGSFPSGHTAIVTSISLAVLSLGSDSWRRWLAGPLVAAIAIATTGLVTIGWHRPSDVIASFFLATAWHRALVARPDPGRPVDLPLGSVVAWWAAACVLVLGAAVDGVLTHTQYGRRAAFVYVAMLGVLLIGALITIALGSARSSQPWGDKTADAHSRDQPTPAAPLPGS